MRNSNPNQFIIYNDEPWTTYDTIDHKDLLGSESIAKALKQIALQAETPITIGIHGRWGCGKTSLMKHIEHLIQKEGVKEVYTVWYNPWMFQFESTPILPLLHEIRNKKFLTSDYLKRKGRRLVDKLIGSLTFDTVLKASLSGVMGNLPGALLSLVEPRNTTQKEADRHPSEKNKKSTILIEAEAEFQGGIKDRYFEAKTTMQRFRETYQSAIDALVGENGRLMIFIDDLDRCVPEQVIKLMEAIKLFLNAEKCVYFLAIDRDVVEKAISARFGDAISGQDYLEKIIQIPFEIPPVAKTRIKTYIEFLNKDVLLETYVDIILEGIIPNPRQIKRFVNTFLLKDQLGQESAMIKYRKGVLAKLMAIQFRYPDLYKEICDSPYIYMALQDYASLCEGGQRYFKWNVGLDMSHYKLSEERFGSLLEKYKDELRLWRILNLDPRIKHLGTLVEHIHLNRVSSAVSGEDIDPELLNFEGIDLSDEKLLWRDFSNMDFSNANFENSNIKGAWFEATNLKNANFRGATLEDIRFIDTNLDESDFRGSEFVATKFMHVSVAGSNFCGAKFDDETLFNLKTGGTDWVQAEWDDNTFKDLAE